jgi:predicted nuclease with RNAse H fold
VDLSAEYTNTVVASIRWDDDHAELVSLEPQATNRTIVEMAVDAAKVGIDCPLGWPKQFVEFITRHQDGQVGVDEAETKDARLRLAYRRTDLLATLGTGPMPLSVSTDRIGRAAMRAAGLLAALETDGVPADRTGRGKIVEVYPAAALRHWHHNSRSYKGKRNSDALQSLVNGFFAETENWLSVDDRFRQQCHDSDDAFDAVIASLNARAATMANGVTEPSADDLADAEVEGWIAVPTCSLAALDPLTYRPRA